MPATLSPTAEKALGKAAITPASEAMQSPAYMAKCEAWARETWGLPYSQVRLMPMEALEPQLSTWLESVCAKPAQLGPRNVESIDITREGEKERA
ncbi:MAG: hypothetical protein SOY94_01165 [Candidatus Limiplasma sp.]|nr:hypothetical protein [Candidatus Limiplasma sp.]